MNRTVRPRLSRRLSSAWRTCLVKASEIGVFSSWYRSGETRFLTRVRGVWPSRYRILQTACTRQTLMSLVSSAPFESCDHSRKRSEEHTSELQSHLNLVCRLL